MRCSFFTAVVRSAAVFVFYSAVASAQVEVVESAPAITPFGQPVNKTAPAVQAEMNAQTELYYQLQTLQQEVAELRGLMEEQAYELKRLKQQRTEDYVDLDRRISELGSGANTGVRNSVSAPTAQDLPGASQTTQVTQSTSSAPAGADELASYNDAMDLIRAKQYDQAIAGFKAYVTKFPRGQYAANSYHWLGQLYQLRNKPADAKAAYQEVVSKWPDHNKASDAKLKLGQLLFQSGDKAKAKSILEEVAASGSDEARLAKNFLQENFK